MKKGTAAIVAAILLSVPLLAHAQASPSRGVLQRVLEEGRQEARLGRTLGAEVLFRRAISIDASDPMSHYLLADLLARSFRHREAIQEYQTAFELNPRSSIAGYCRQALLAYGVRPNDMAELGFRRQDKPELPDSPPTHVDTAMDTIDRQAQFEKARKHNFATNLGKTAIKGGDWRANEIKAVAESEIAHLRSTSAKASLGRTSSDMDAQEKRIRKEAEDRAKLEREMAQERSERHREWSQERGQELDDVANNLKGQLNTKPSTYGFDLHPTGTGLYVRNYKSSQGKRKLPEPRFSVVRFVDRGMEDDVSSPKPNKP